MANQLADFGYVQPEAVEVFCLIGWLVENRSIHWKRFQWKWFSRELEAELEILQLQNLLTEFLTEELVKLLNFQSISSGNFFALMRLSLDCKICSANLGERNAQIIRL